MKSYSGTLWTVCVLAITVLLGVGVVAAVMGK